MKPLTVATKRDAALVTKRLNLEARLKAMQRQDRLRLTAKLVEALAADTVAARRRR